MVHQLGDERLLRPPITYPIFHSERRFWRSRRRARPLETDISGKDSAAEEPNVNSASALSHPGYRLRAL